MKTFVPELSYCYEMRGRYWYGFCDYGCKAIVRANGTQLRAAMRIHHTDKHSGQLALFGTSQDSAPRF